MKIEKIILSIAFLALILKYAGIPGMSFFVVILFTFSSMMYFPAGFYFLSNGKIKEQNIGLSVVSGIAFGIILLGILFKVQCWPMSGFYLFIGSILVLIMTIITVIIKTSAKIELKEYFK